MSRKRIFYIVFFAVLVIGFYVALTKFVPGFGKEQFPPLGYVQPFSFINQDGKTITEKDVDGKIVVVNYFFTTCKTVCPRMNNYMKNVYDKFKDEKDVLMLSHTCQPEIDSLPLLKKYADSMQVNTAKWMFLTGDKTALYKQARLSYKIDDPKNNVNDAKDDFMHTQFIALVNKKGEVLKVYDGIKLTEVNEMIQDIEKLLKEK